MTLKKTTWAGGVVVVVLAVGVIWLFTRDDDKAADSATPAAKSASGPKAALSVSTVRPESSQWPAAVTATGSIAAWQETVIGPELSGLRLVEVRVNVGDVVRKGQVLAVLQRDAVQSEVNAARANVAQTEANLGEAKANADRARVLEPSEAMSAQEAQRAYTAEKTAAAQVASAKASLQSNELRLSQTQVVASDDGVISARPATVGTVVQAGQELFRLIRQHRLEWRAEVPAADLLRVKPRMAVHLTPAGGQEMQGTVRMVAPTVDAGTRNGLVYVDLPVQAGARAGARAGSFATGRLDMGTAEGLTLPQAAVLLRDGFNYVFIVGTDHKVTQTKISVGRRMQDRIEITKGLPAQAEVVSSGGVFLADGDTVRVVPAPASSPAPAASASVAGKAQP
ncbi:MAG: efflux RND transporter periplasmic adaptor subunit [Aquabacterium sp.]|jgi:HlyD family secretion protein|uniref:efflux RND transporter periplasmic adaptor subunit n=1 Tax=Aquabacterium sp. TaxID=1872578 RepID=UPI003BB15B89